MTADYFYIEDWTDHYQVKMTDKFYDIVRPYYKPEKLNSYFSIFYRLYNLPPYEFYHYIINTFNATLIKSQVAKTIIINFKNKNDAINFKKDLTQRFLKIKELKNV